MARDRPDQIAGRDDIFGGTLQKNCIDHAGCTMPNAGLRRDSGHRPYVFLMRPSVDSDGALTVQALITPPLEWMGASHGRSDFLRARRRPVSRLRLLCRPPEEALSMIVAIIYAAAALAIGIYMVAALVRPDKF
ncbi:MAG: hypothetical protein M3N05_07675 [Pseudomonadota bacterium]|nr:hypothetical protein [Pseudomonadota bacterium]